MLCCISVQQIVIASVKASAENIGYTLQAFPCCLQKDSGFCMTLIAVCASLIIFVTPETS